MPEGKNSCLWLKLIIEIYDQPAVGHPEAKQTQNMICCHYYWPSMHWKIEQYFCNCHVYKQAKSTWDAYNSFFQPLPVSKRFWVNLTMDFVIHLPRSQGYDAILMMVDQLSKEKHYIPCTKKWQHKCRSHSRPIFLLYLVLPRPANQFYLQSRPSVCFKNMRFAILAPKDQSKAIHYIASQDR